MRSEAHALAQAVAAVLTRDGLPATTHADEAVYSPPINQPLPDPHLRVLPAPANPEHPGDRRVRVSVSVHDPSSSVPDNVAEDLLNQAANALGGYAVTKVARSLIVTAPAETAPS